MAKKIAKIFHPDVVYYQKKFGVFSVFGFGASCSRVHTAQNHWIGFRNLVSELFAFKKKKIGGIIATNW